MMSQFAREILKDGDSERDAVVRLEGVLEGMLRGRKIGWKEGLEEGLEEGWKRGWMEGWKKGLEEERRKEAASILLKQIRRKFGQIPDWVAEKVISADLDVIRTWSEAILFANSVDEVFAP